VHPIPSTQDVGLAWLERMRWGTVASSFVVLLVARFVLRIDVPVATLLGLLTFSAGTNVLLSVLIRRRALPQIVPAAVLAFDIALLTFVLRLSGGASNPFSALYIVYVTLGAVLLSARATWLLVLLATAGFALLFVGHSAGSHAMHGGMQGMHQMPDGTWMQNGPGMGATSALDPFLSHLYGMLAAFAISAVLIAFFVTRLSTALRLRDAELERARARSTRVERLASLTTLAAGAAHELGSPLGTIAIAAKELERALRQRTETALADEALLVREEARRCRAILDGMAARAGESIGEAPSRVDLALVTEQLVASRRAALGDRAPKLVVEAQTCLVRAPERAVTSVIENLLDNAIDASATRVTARITQSGEEARVAIEDDGAGMTAETLAHATEPFFTTKVEGRGMGLGLFLVSTIVERLGGRFELSSTEGAGTHATVCLPREQRA
jgi:two-component system, sensor histidine kinase RegB